MYYLGEVVSFITLWQIFSGQ